MATLQDALRFAEDWSLPVFPCGPDKKPLTPHGFKDASCNIEAIAAMWPPRGALIGYPTGAASKLLVIDVDPDGLPWFTQHVDKLSPGVVVKTPRGFHLLYRMPLDHDIRCSTSQLSRGADVRANGGYAIMYAGEGLQMTGDLGDVTNVPETLLAKLIRPRGRAGDAGARDAGDAYGAQLNGHAIPEGLRNSWLTSEAGKLRRAGLEAHEIFAALLGLNSALCVPPLTDAEVQRIAISVARYAVPAADVPEIIPMTRLADVSLHEDSVDLVTGLIPEGKLAVIYGAPNSGKSTLALEIGFAVANGIPWRGFDTRQGLVVYSAAEDRVGVERRLWALQREYPQATHDLMRMDWNATNLRNPDAVTALIGRIQEEEAKCGQDCRLLQIDTLMEHLYGNDSDAQHMTELLVGLKRVQREIECAVLLNHHSGKDPTRGARGHSSLLGAIDTEMEVTDEKGTHWCKVTKQRNGEIMPPMAFGLTRKHLGFNVAGKEISTVVVDHRNLVPPKKEPEGDQQRKVLAELQRRATAGEVTWTAKDIVDIGKALGLPVSTQYAMRESLAKGGFIQPSIDGYTLVP